MEDARREQPPQPRFPPLLAVAVGIASVSFSAILVRLALGERGAEMALSISFYRVLFATLALLPFTVALRRAELRELARARRDLLVLGAVGLALALHFALWITSLAFTTVASSVVIVALESVFVPVGAHFLLREPVPRAMALGILVAFLGTATIFGGDLLQPRSAGPRALLGDGMALLAAVAATLYFLAGRRYRQRMSLLTYATFVYAVCTLGLLALALAFRAPLAGFEARVWLLFAAMAVFPHLLGHTMLNWALRWVPAPVVSLSVVAEPIVSSALAAVLFREVPGAVALLGAAVTILAVVYVMRMQARGMRPAPQVAAA